MKLNFKNIKELEEEFEKLNDTYKDINSRINMTLRLPEKVYSEFTDLYILEFKRKYGKDCYIQKEPELIGYTYSNLNIDIVSNEKKS